MSVAPQALDIDALYASKIGPALEGLEGGRQQALASFQRAFVWIIPLTLFVGWVAFQFFDAGFVSVIGMLIVGGVSTAIAYQPLQKVSEATKISVLSAIADALGLIYKPEIDEPPFFDQVDRFGCLPSYDRGSFEDQWEGIYKLRAFTLYEAHLEQERKDSDGDTTWETVFRGQIIRLELPRSITGITVLNGNFGLVGAITGKSGDFKPVRFPISSFTKNFTAWSSDQVEARYLLDPLVLEKLIDLQKHLSGGDIRAIFDESSAYFLVNGEDLFEIGSMFKALPSVERARKVAGDLASLWAVIDVLADRSRAADVEDAAHA